MLLRVAIFFFFLLLAASLTVATCCWWLLRYVSVICCCLLYKLVAASACCFFSFRSCFRLLAVAAYYCLTDWCCFKLLSVASTLKLLLLSVANVLLLCFTYFILIFVSFLLWTTLLFPLSSPKNATLSAPVLYEFPRLESVSEYWSTTSTIVWYLWRHPIMKKFSLSARTFSTPRGDRTIMALECGKLQ